MYIYMYIYIYIYIHTHIYICIGLTRTLAICFRPCVAPSRRETRSSRLCRAARSTPATLCRSGSTSLTCQMSSRPSAPRFICLYRSTINVSISKYLYIYLSMCIYLSTYLHIYLSSIHVYIYMYIYTYRYISIYLYVHVSIYLSIYDCIYLHLDLRPRRAAVPARPR